jgi:hypothetical protein
MPFTGRIGTQNSQLGNIVLGIVDAFDLPTVGFKVHVLSSREVRVRFDRPVTDSALSLTSYILAAVTPGSVVPAVASVDFYDADRLSVVVRTLLPLTFSSTYSMQVVGVNGYDGEGVTSVSSNFTANVPDAPRAVGAFLSKRGAIDLVFDRPVGQTATGATAVIHSAGGGPAVGMIFQPWLAEAMPENTLRFVYPNTTPLASGYEIDYASIVDSSNNVGSGIVPVTLRLRSPAPYNSSSLSQMQFLDAYVSEIVPNVNAATVRVYFSGPAFPNDVLNLGSWNITQGGPHPEPDIVHSVIVPDCITFTDVLNFLNAVRTTLAAHVLEDSIHRDLQPTVSATLLAVPVATDYVTALNVYYAIKNAFKDHALESLDPGNHLYPELVPIPEPPAIPNDFPGIIAATNGLKALYNQHLAAERNLPYAGNYPLEIGYITDHASQAAAYPVTNDLTYFADVHVVTHVASLPVRVRGTVRSHDLSSTTNPADYTGDIQARAVLAPGLLLTKEIFLDREVRASFDKEIVVPDLSSVSVQNSAYGPLSVVRPVPTSTVPDAVWFLNSLVYAYSKHLEPAPVGAGHVTTENQFFVVPADYVTTTDLPTLMFKANILKMKYNGHVRNANVHTNLDEKVTARDAFDFPSLVALLGALRESFNGHNASGDFPSIVLSPKLPGHHSTPGEAFLVAKLLSALSVTFDGMLDSTEHRLTAKVVDAKLDLLRKRPASSPVLVDTVFRGFATRPSVASALPRPGLVFHEDRERRLFYSFETDSIEVYFSKRMHKTELNGGTGSTIFVSGGLLVLKGADWVDERLASVRVVNMEQISYTLTASGLVDKAGNPIL